MSVDTSSTDRSTAPAAWSIRNRIRAHPLACYLVLAYGLSWGYWIPMALDYHGLIDVPWTSHFPGLTGPMFAALITTWLVTGRAGLVELAGRMTRWRVGWWWFAVAAVGPLLLLVAALPVAAATGSTIPTLEEFGRLNGLPSAGPLGIWVLLLLVNGVGEETGWRGYAQDHLQTRMRPLEATGFVALVWAAWHLPVFFFVDNFLDMGALEILGWIVGLSLGGAVVLAWLYNRTSQSVLMVALWHASYNWAVATEGSTGTIAAIVSTVVMVCGIVILRREVRARRQRRDESIIAPATERT